MGCPARKVTGGYGGAALMRDPDLALRLIEATVAAASVPVTLKMRLGWDEGTINAPEIARRAVDAGIAMIAVHGRTRCQFYGGAADWSAIAAVKDAVSVPVVANGDLVSVEDGPAMLAASGADAVMIGRGAIGRPWFPGMVARFLATGIGEAEPEGAELVARLAELVEEMVGHWGADHGVRLARKHLAAAMKRLEGGEREALSPLRRAVLPGVRPETIIKDLAAFAEAAGSIRRAA
ncbi:MAG: tRNA-dihydrouridine synthase [Hyphomicrobiales bacterium]